jgi:RNA polymerase sigma factor (sigma-70 family)
MLEVIDEETLVVEAPPELALEAESWQASLNTALQEMSPVTRAVLLLKFRDNRRCSDIARDLGLTDRQVRRHLTRCYERLRRAMMS